MDGIKDEETAIEDVAAVETDRFTVARNGWGGLDAHDDIAGAVNLDELVVPGGILVLVVYGAMGGIGEGPEVPAVEEGIALLEDRRRFKLGRLAESAWKRRHSRLSP